MRRFLRKRALYCKAAGGIRSIACGWPSQINAKQIKPTEKIAQKRFRLCHMCSRRPPWAWSGPAVALTGRQSASDKRLAEIKFREANAKIARWRNVSGPSRRRIAQTPSKIGAGWRGSIGEPDIRTDRAPQRARIRLSSSCRSRRQTRWPEPRVSKAKLRFPSLLSCSLRSHYSRPYGAVAHYLDRPEHRKRAAAALPVRLGQAWLYARGLRRPAYHTRAGV
jgi:hypothetical protein